MTIRKLLAIPRSMVYNIRIFGINGGFPLLISNKTRMKGAYKGCIEALSPKRFSITVGFGGSDGVVENQYSSLIFGKTGKLVIAEAAEFAKGSSIRVEQGTLRIGSNFSCNKNCFFSCDSEMEIGNDVLLGWNVNIRDTDGHRMYYNGNVTENKKPVKIGNHVWLASFVDVMKGAGIPDGCVVSYRSIVNSRLQGEGSLIAGNPARVIKQGVSWEK